MGIDRFIRIKYYATFTTILTIKFILALMTIACSAALISVIGIAAGLHLQKEQVFTAIGFVFGIMVIIIVNLLQVLVIRTSNDVHSISRIDASQLPRKSSN